MWCLSISISVIDDCRWISWWCERYEYMRTFGVQILLLWKPGLGNGHCGDQSMKTAVIIVQQCPLSALRKLGRCRSFGDMARKGLALGCMYPGVPLSYLNRRGRCQQHLISTTVVDASASCQLTPVDASWRQCFLLMSFTTTQSLGWRLGSCTNVGSRRAAFTLGKISFKEWLSAQQWLSISSSNPVRVNLFWGNGVLVILIGQPVSIS